MPLIDKLIEDNVLITPKIISAFKKIKRADFLPTELIAASDLDEPLPIGYGQTNSQPFTVAFMFEKLQPEPGDKILDIGCGTGWTTALAAEIVGRKGSVCGMEIVPELKIAAENNLKKFDNFFSRRVKFFLGDGRLGLPEFAPFDKIMVSAASAQIPPPLLEQLKIGGRLILPIGEEFSIQSLVLIQKTAAEIKRTNFPGFVFVPLIKP